MNIKVTELVEITHKAILHYGFNEQEASAIEDILLYAQLRGNNQGVVKLIGKGIPKQPTAGNPKKIKETPVSALFDGNGTHAMLVMNLVTDTAIQKAKLSGIAIVGNYNTAESTGALGYYVHKIAHEGLVGIAFASAPFQTTAPEGSTEALFCTNPMAYGIPTTTSPIILDMSTSAMAYYGLIEAKTASKSVPAGTGYDKEGKPTTNPAEIMSGALKTFGGHKGSGLALVVQVLAGALVQAESFNSESNNAGDLVIAIDPDILTTKDAFTKEVSNITSRIKSARKAEGVSEIYIPGEQSQKFNDETTRTGAVEIEENLLNELKKVAAL
jgi:LDH2 family malate/lactate/ureidoglycolate dehydrogenase